MPVAASASRRVRPRPSEAKSCGAMSPTLSARSSAAEACQSVGQGGAVRLGPSELEVLIAAHRLGQLRNGDALVGTDLVEALHQRADRVDVLVDHGALDAANLGHAEEV